MARNCGSKKSGHNCGMRGGLFNPFFQGDNDLTGQNGGGGPSASTSALYLQLLPYITGESTPSGDYIGNLYLQLLPYITGESTPSGDSISIIYLQLLPYIDGELVP